MIQYTNDITKIKYEDFYLIKKNYYVIEVFDNVTENKFFGIAQLTRIDSIDDGEYYVVHFKHNKKEYLQYVTGRHSPPDYYRQIKCKCLRHQTAEYGFAYNNSRIRINESGNYYFPENYRPGLHK